MEFHLKPKQSPGTTITLLIGYRIVDTEDVIDRSNIPFTITPIEDIEIPIKDVVITWWTRTFYDWHWIRPNFRIIFLSVSYSWYVERIRFGNVAVQTMSWRLTKIESWRLSTIIRYKLTKSTQRLDQPLLLYEIVPPGRAYFKNKNLEDDIALSCRL